MPKPSLEAGQGASGLFKVMRSRPEVGDAEVEEVVTGDGGHDGLEQLTRPLLEALAKIAGLECTYLTVFDWARGEQEVRFVHRGGDLEIAEGSRVALPEGVSPEILLTRSPAQMPQTHPDRQAAKRLGLRTYVSVPVVLPTHELFGMVCGVSRRPLRVREPVMSIMEAFAQIVATEQRAERAEAQLRARGFFLAVAEHQLKTPLTSLLGAARVLREGGSDLGQDQRDVFLDMVIRSALDLAGRVEALLVEARADLQSRDLVPVDLDLMEFLEPIARAFDAVSDHHVRAEVEHGVTAFGDPSALHQVLGHLLDNAVKYAPAHSMIKVVAHRTHDGVAIAVVDEGPGLPNGVEIFEAFRRGEPDQKGGAPGIGLGLHIVRNLVRAMGGSVDATANAEGGTTFTLGLPSAQSPRRRPAPPGGA